jgi:Zn-finger nucleic acid-binding protein
MDDDPYRSSQLVGTCPRCSNTLESDGEGARLVCLQGCGEWYPREMFEKAWATIVAGGESARPQPWPWSPARCSSCRGEMKVGYREELRYDYCAPHGVWLDAGEIRRFTELFFRVVI